MQSVRCENDWRTFIRRESVEVGSPAALLMCALSPTDVQGKVSGARRFVGSALLRFSGRGFESGFW
jgi:hypothetical protein